MLRKYFLGIALMMAIGIFLWLVGLAWFLSRVPQQAPHLDSAKDAIVVLTGGSLRVDNGLELLAKGMGKKLFISGVPEGVTLKDLYRNKPQAKYLSYFTDGYYIVLGHEAVDTKTNAIETANWIRRENFKSIILVTAYYHIPRSLRELQQMMPDIEITPYPVFPEISNEASWWKSPELSRLLISEYHKTLASILHSFLFRL